MCPARVPLIAAVTPGLDRFELFTPPHFAGLAITIVTAVALALFVRQAAHWPSYPSIRKSVCYALAVLLFAAWIAEDIWQLSGDHFNIQESLPLHLCDFALVLCLFCLWGMAAAPRAGPAPTAVHPQPAPDPMLQFLYELAYFWGLGGTTQALLTPELRANFPSFLCIRFFVTHGGIVVAVLLLTIGLRLRPRPSSPVRVFFATAALAPPMMLINWLLGSNYMYVNRKPDQATVLDLFGDYPMTLLGLVLLAALLIAFCYLPFWIMDRRRDRSRHAAETA